VRHGELQAALQRWTGGTLVDLHVSDLLNNQLPSHFDYTSWYDLLVFRRLAAGPAPSSLRRRRHGTLGQRAQALAPSTPARWASRCSTACC
jgi:magnesium transporter